MSNTITLEWFNNEDGNMIVGTHNRNVSDPFHDTQIDGMLWGMDDLEEYYARNLDTIVYLYLRPDWETADENTNLNIDPTSGKPCTKYNGIPAIWYGH